MRMHHLFAVVLLALPAVSWADPPVTSKDVPAPGPVQSRLWLEAIFQAPLLEYCDASVPRSEALRMLVAVQRGQKLGPGVGWYDPSRRRHDWAWLATRLDRDGNGRILRKEFTGADEWFKQMDRDRDGAITPEDLDWSESSDWVRRDAQSLRLLRNMDQDGNGRIDDAEWLAYFKKMTGEKTTLNAEDFRDILAATERGEKGKAKKVSREIWLQCLLAGDLGSPLQGPRVDQAAPDFTLSAQDGKKKITLSDYRGKKPVVLIFGSFT
ncbi:MAG: redoxin domain-containing protein [Gemmataceae bacterium]|nr:redoxin domain-containing protein [Gemmataceae bacterium]MCI0737884.1 redoxin domain-containing protein [Gemmataceae bacterium]